ncbi:capsid maturation protease [Mycobacterium phage Kykar]|nr:capsid maturation protease [Mycobacterium phage Kykar]
MTPEEYAALQTVISAATARYVLQFGTLFRNPLLSLAEWLGLLELLFPQVVQQRTEAAALARRFYDDYRAQHHPELPRNDRPLEAYDFQTFVHDMDPARVEMSKEDATEYALGQLTLRAVRSVENAGRQQIIHAVEEDPAPPRVLRGWARVATGRETCAWCLMLISRGPTYVRAETAGIDLDTEHALELFKNNDLETYFAEIGGAMEQWHAGCDCKVIPVFRSEGWFGEQAADRALDLWGDATKEAIELEDEGLVHKYGKKKGQPFTRNELAINALRRRLERGEIDPREFAGLAA